MLQVVRAVIKNELYCTSRLPSARSISSLLLNKYHATKEQNATEVKRPNVPTQLWQPGCVISSQPWLWETVRMAGHSKWQNIRHTKATKDSEKSNATTKLVRKINVAIMEGGSADTKFNRQLARVCSEAQRMNIPKTTVDAAIKRGQEKREASQKHLICAVGPGSCFLLIECFTDKVARTKQEITSIIKRHGAKLADMKMAAYSFSEKGVVRIPGADNSLNMDQAEELAIQAGAEEVILETDNEEAIWKFICDPMDLPSVKSNLEAENLEISFSGHQYIAANYTKVSEVNQEILSKLFDKLEAHADVVNIYDNIQVE